MRKTYSVSLKLGEFPLVKNQNFKWKIPFIRTHIYSTQIQEEIIMKLKRLITTILALSMLLGNTAFASDMYATRGEVADMLLLAADDYNPTVERSDIIKGYDDGELHEDWNITRAEALVMLKRAFGTLPELTGHNARVALKSGDFTDIPEWA